MDSLPPPQQLCGPEIDVLRIFDAEDDGCVGLVREPLTCVCVCVYVCLRACVRACVHVCVCVRVRVRAHIARVESLCGVVVCGTLHKRNRVIYLRCFFLRYFCWEYIVFWSKVALLCTILATISCPLTPEFFNSVILSWSSFWAVFLSTKSRLSFPLTAFHA